MSVHLQPVYENVIYYLAKAHDGVGFATGVLCALVEIVAKKVKKFIQENWKQLLIYIIAWGVIISCSGVLYGFDKVAFPLAIGFGCGLGVGMAIGALSANTFDKAGKYTAWNLANYLLEGLDPQGTRQIVIAIVVTVILAAAVVLPYAVGALIGIVAGNQLAAKMVTGRKMGSDPNKSRLEQKFMKLKKEHEELKKKCKKLGIDIGKLQKKFPKLHNSDNSSSSIEIINENYSKN